MLSPIPAPRVSVLCILILAGLTLCSSVLKADIIYSTFGVNGAYSDGTGIMVTDGVNDYSIAFQFTPVDNYDLSSIEFVATSAAQTPDLGSVTLGIFADNSGHPGGTALESLSWNGQFSEYGDLAPVMTVTSSSHPDYMPAQPTGWRWMLLWTSKSNGTKTRSELSASNRRTSPRGAGSYRPVPPRAW
jgi:hypothetical protein